MFDVVKYVKAKAVGAASIYKENYSYFVSFKKYDPTTGEQLQNEVQRIELATLEYRKQELQTELDAVNAVLAEANAL